MWSLVLLFAKYFGRFRRRMAPPFARFASSMPANNWNLAIQPLFAQFAIQTLLAQEDAEHLVTTAFKKNPL
jgi:hypothetical protein